MEEIGLEVIFHGLQEVTLILVNLKESMHQEKKDD